MPDGRRSWITLDGNEAVARVAYRLADGRTGGSVGGPGRPNLWSAVPTVVELQSAREGRNPLQLNSKAPSLPLKAYAYNETRYTKLAHSHPAGPRRSLHA